MKGVLLLCAGALLLQLCYSQDACENLTLGDLGSTTQLEASGLLSEALTQSGEAAPPTVQVIDMQIVCESQHEEQDRYRYVSVVAHFSCLSGDTVRLPECTGASSDVTQQFEFGCASGSWSRLILSVVNPRTTSPTANLETDKDSGCNFCISPDNSQAVSLGLTVDTVTHCTDCDASCSMGLQRCITRTNCCSYFYNNLCVASCPGQLTGDNDDFECRCDELSDDNGQFAYSDGQNVNSVANLTCNGGYTESVSIATCSENGWSATPVCNRVDCDVVDMLTNGVESYSDGTFAGSVVTYSCNTGFFLEGVSMRTCQNNGMWTGTDPSCTPCSEKITDCLECTADSNGVVECTECGLGLTYIPADQECKDVTTDTGAASSCPIGCIIAIVLSILAVIVIAIVLTVVAFVLYKYLSDPATKLAQAGAGGLNGVARDNPLYVDPAAVTEEGIDGVENGVTETTPLDS